MGVSVDYFRQFTEYCTNKNQAGQTVTPEQFNIVANQAQMLQFTNDYETFVQTGVVSNYLKTFLKIGTVYQVPPTTATIPYPSDFQYISSVRRLYNGTQIKVEYINNEDVGDVLTPNSLLAPTHRFPKYQYIEDGINFFPNDIGVIYLDYFATPTAPIWNYTITNNEPVYNPIGSVNFDWDSYFLNNISAVYLSLVGVNLSDTNIAGFAEMFKKETKVAI